MYNNRYYNEMPRNERHIQNEEQYRNAIRNLKKGEYWKIENLINRSDVNFNEEQYTPYDYAYAVNAMKSDYDISDKPEQYMRMAKEYLRNDSFPERGGERAYYDAQRRSMRYENRFDPYMGNERYEYENRRRYNERNSFRDRDNDGRYNE